MYAVKLYNVWKKYHIDYKRRLSFRDNLLNLFKGFKPNNEFWALKGISLEVKKGEALGIIGRNGSGKTTLLRLIPSITKPTTGCIKVNGRVGCLLALGAGFQGDLTGRENIYLNGAILGLSREDIKNKIDSIIDFADIGDFIDALVSTYSSGMYLRLGFSIAAQLNTDILLIDEVLTVGDLSFQEKCLRKVKELKKINNTLILSSHNMNIVTQICDNVVWLEEGKIIKMGRTKEIIKEYEIFMQREDKKMTLRRANFELEINDVYFLNGHENPADTFITGERMIVRIEYFAYKPINNPVFGLAISKDDGTLITGPNTKCSDFIIESIEGKGAIDFIIDSLPLLTGNYCVSIAIHTYEDELAQYDSLDRLFRFRVVSDKAKEKHGVISMAHRWRMGNQSSDFNDKCPDSKITAKDIKNQY